MPLPVDPDSLAGDVPTTGDRDQITVTAPADGRRLGTVPQCTEEDVRSAVSAARNAQATWQERPVRERSALLRAVASALLDRRADLYDVVCVETGKARRDAAEEVADAVATAQYYADEGPAMFESRRRSGVVPFLTRTTEHRDPLGVVGFITPWNYPLTLVVSDAFPALLAGNTVVVKADERTPLTALFVRRVLLEAGIPPDVFQVLTGSGEILGNPLIDAVDGIGFTGSTEVGREVAGIAGRTLTPASLELGGNNPLIVLPDADPERAAAGTIRGAFANGGQLCLAIERIYVHEAVSDRYLEELETRTQDLSLGVDGTWEDDVGSLLSARQLRTTQRHVADALDRGATLRTGGTHRPDIGPWVYEPTILTDVPSDALVTGGETFGPVVTVDTVSNVDAAVDRANDSPYGLNASVWGTDTENAEAVARRIRCGTVNVNEAYLAAWSSFGAPMGGMKDSGLGRRHGEAGLTRWTESQTVATQRGLLIALPWLPDHTWERVVMAFLRGREAYAGVLARLRDRLSLP